MMKIGMDNEIVSNVKMVSYEKLRKLEHSCGHKRKRSNELAHKTCLDYNYAKKIFKSF